MQSRTLTWPWQIVQYFSQVQYSSVFSHWLQTIWSAHENLSGNST